MAENTTPLRVGDFVITPALTRLIAAVLSALVLAWAGIRATRSGAVRRADLRRAEATLATFAEWRRTFEPAVAAYGQASKRLPLSATFKRAPMKERASSAAQNLRVGL